MIANYLRHVMFKNTKFRL